MTISEIKSSLPILTLLSHYAITPDRNKRISCPFHNDKTPSMQVYPDTNTVYCFSSNCPHGRKTIDQIDFVMHKENCTKHQAILKCKQLLGRSGLSKTIKPMPSSIYQDLNQIFTQLQKRFHRGANAKKYANSRSIIDANIPIGWNTYKTDFAHLRNCIIFPLKNKEGDVVSLYGRSITGQGNNAHYYLKNRKGLYPGYPVTNISTLVITEAIIDA